MTMVEDEYLQLWLYLQQL